MTERRIEIKKGTVSRIYLNRPEKRNALSPEMIRALIDALLTLGDDPAVKVIILAGRGKGFCAGADLGNMLDADFAAKRAYTGLIPQLLQTLPKTKAVTIAQVHGFAVAGAFGLAMACDLAVATPDCRFGLPEIKNGLMPMNIMAVLSRVLAPKHLFELMMTGENMSGQQAYERGYVNRLATEDALEAATDALAGSIAAYKTGAIKLGKEAFYTARDMEYNKSLSYLNHMLLGVMQAED